jgi:membrane-bound lytic murein transglycosylase D
MKYISIFSMAVAAVITVAFFSSSKKGEPTQGEKEGQSFQTIKPFKTPDYLDFAGEPLPLNNFDVKERLDLELIINAYGHSNAIVSMKRSGKYFPIIESILAKNGIPDDFKYLAIAESALKNATSSAGAKGIWQFMTPTAEYYGLVINSEVDERYNVELVTEAACKYLKTAYKRFNSWTLAAASYNMGEPILQKRLKEQGVSSYYDVHLTEETLRYVFRIAAIKEIYSHPEKYGFYLDDSDKYEQMQFTTKTISSSIPDLAAFAKENGTTYRKLKIYNPWLLDSHLTNASKHTYTIKIPLN